jgi:hypothetical protein
MESGASERRDKKADDGKDDNIEREKKKDNRSKSKNRKPTMPKLTKKGKKSMGRDEQTRKKQQQKLQV